MALAREITYLRTLGLGDVDLARAAGSTQDDRLWPPSDVGATVWGERVRVLVQCALRLEEMAAQRAVAPWLRSAVPALAYAAPLDLIGQDRGEEVAAVIDALADAPAG